MPVKLPKDKYIKVGNIDTRYWEAGNKGSTVVLVHGLGGFCENWMYNIEPLAKKHRVYAFDLVGFGRSDKTPLVKDIFQLVQFINDFMDTLKNLQSHFNRELFRGRIGFTVHPPVSAKSRKAGADGQRRHGTGCNC